MAFSPPRKVTRNVNGSLRYRLSAAQLSPRILLAEDCAAMRELIAAALKKDGFEVIEVSNGAELVESMSALLCPGSDPPPIDLVITDIRMPRLSGLDALGKLRWYDNKTPFILITGFGDPQTHAEAVRLGANAIFNKPFDLADLRTAVLHLLTQGKDTPSDPF